VNVWVTSTLAAAGLADLLKYVSLIAGSHDRFIQERLTPLDIERGSDLTHLKRVRRSGNKTDDGVDIVDIILCAESTMSVHELEEILKDASKRNLEILPRIEKVSRWPAYNNRQLSEFRSLWPVSFRKDSTRYLPSSSV
jgi:hypothetical protein